MDFWQGYWPILDAVVHIIVPSIVCLSVYIAIEVFFSNDEKMMMKLTPKERNKLTFKRKRDKTFITELGWTRSVLYAGLKKNSFSK